MIRRRDPGARDDESRDRPLRLFRQFTRAGRAAPFVAQPCEHMGAAPARDVGHPEDCEDHRPDDEPVVHLRVCLECGHVGCCDSSIPQHATKHAMATGHPVIQSGEPGETWRWCYPDELLG